MRKCSLGIGYVCHMNNVKDFLVPLRHGQGTPVASRELADLHTLYLYISEILSNEGEELEEKLDKTVC